MNPLGSALPADGALAGPREWLGLAVIALPCVVYAMDLTVLNLAVPALSADLRPSSTQLLWIVDIYGFLVAGFLITMGTLGDRLGRRRVLLAGAAAFAAASLLAAMSTSVVMLLGARALLGVAGAALAPSTLALITTMFRDPRQRTVAIGVWIMSFSAGAAIGPVVGGALLEHYWWGSVFLPAIPVMALLLVAGPRLLPEYRDPGAGRVDLASVVLSLAAVLAVIYGLKQAVQHGLGWSSLLAVAAGGVAGVLFLRRQRTLADPLLDLHLFRVPAFSAALAAYTFGFFVNFGALLYVAQYLQLVLELSPLRAGLWTVPAAAAFIVGAMLTPRVARRLAPGLIVASGLAVAAAGFTLLAFLGAAPGLPVLVTGSVIASAGLAAVFTLATDLMLASSAPERAGGAAAVAETGSELGGALGIAVLGSVGVAVYRAEVADSISPAVPTEVAEAARDTLGGAVAASDALPPILSGEVLDAARAAFTDGLQVSAAASAAVVGVAACFAFALLRRSGRVTMLPAPSGAEPTVAVTGIGAQAYHGRDEAASC